MEDLDQIYARLKSRKEGLTASEAAARLQEFGPNVLKPKQRCRWVILLGILIWFFLSVEIAKYFFFRRKKKLKTS